MITQGKVGRTEASKLGISMFDCKGLSIRDISERIRAEHPRGVDPKDPTLESAKAASPDPTISVDADQIVEVKDASGDRTMEADSKDVRIVSGSSSGKSAGTDEGDVSALLRGIARITGAPPPQKRPRMIGERSEDSVLFDMGGAPGAGVGSSVEMSLEEIKRAAAEAERKAKEPPPAEPKPKLTGQRSEDSVLFQMGGEPRTGGESSVEMSLEDVRRLGAQAAAERPVPAAKKEPGKVPDSSVEMSLKELQGIERDRNESEQAAREEAARAEQERLAFMEAQRREAEQAAEEARIREAEEQLGRAVDELLASIPDGEAGQRSVVYRMGEVEMLLYSEFLPQGQSRWIIPVGLSGQPEKDAETAAKIGEAQTIIIAEKTYYICEKDHGLDKAIEAVRMGSELRLGTRKPAEISVEIEIEADSGAHAPAGLPWEQEYMTHTLEGEELVAGKIVLPERAVRWLMPLPDESTPEAAAKAIFRRFRDEPRLTLGGKTYFVFAGGEGFAGAKWCARTGNMLQIWSAAMTDYSVESSMGGSAPAVRAMEGTESSGPGLPWDASHVQHMLQGDELVAAFGALPERAVRWLVPAPEEGMKDRVSQSIRKKFGAHPRIEIEGKTYYVYDGEDGFAGARWCARTGNILNVWRQSMTEYDYMGSVDGSSIEGALRTVSESAWPRNLFYHTMSAEEMERSSTYFPERMPVLMHPVPDADTAIAAEKAMLEEMPRMWGCATVRLGEREYYVISMDSVKRWKDVVMMHPEMRIASREGGQVNVWEEAGRSLFASTTFHIFETTARGAPLPPRGGSLVPYDEEVLDVEYLYEYGKKSRFLYPLPEKVSEMGIDTFNNLLGITTGEVRRTGHSPLISLHGRWYFALEYCYAGSRLTALEGGKLKIYPQDHAGRSQREILARMKARLSGKKEDEEFVTLPEEPGQRNVLLTSFPPGKVRYLYNVDAQDPNFVSHDSDLIVRDGDFDSVWRMADQPIPGMTIPVVRRGERIFPVREEEPKAGRPASVAPQGQTASELLASLPSGFPRNADPTMELSASDLEAVAPAERTPPKRGTIRGMPPLAGSRKAEKKGGAEGAAGEPSGAIEIHTGEFEIADDEPEN